MQISVFELAQIAVIRGVVWGFQPVQWPQMENPKGAHGYSGVNPA